ncbi:MAG: PDZ domain-containing protein [Pirellulales bacterium]
MMATAAAAAAMNEPPGAERRPIVTDPPAPERLTVTQSAATQSAATEPVTPAGWVRLDRWANLIRRVIVVSLTLVSLTATPSTQPLLGQDPESPPDQVRQQEELSGESGGGETNGLDGQWSSQFQQVVQRWSGQPGTPPVLAAISVRYPRRLPGSPQPVAGESLDGAPPNGAGLELDRPDHWTMAILVAAESAPLRLLTTYHGLGLPLESSAGTPQFEAHIGTVSRAFPARLVGADPWSDLAVLELVVEPTGEQPVSGAPAEAGTEILAEAGMRLEDAGPLPVGEQVVVLGNPLAWMQSGRPSVARGWAANVQRGPVASARRGMTGSESYASRYQLGQLTELDLRLSGLGSGCPVLDDDGRLRGITTTAAVVAGYDPGAAYAIPVDRGLLRIVAELSAGREVGYGFLGLRPDQVTTQPGDGKESSGVRVVSVLAGTPAHQAGLRDGDIVTRLGEVAIESPQQLEWQAASHAPGERVELEVARPGGLLRRERSVVLQVRLSKKPRVNDPPAVVTAPARSWRGVQVDYITAAADFDRHLAAMEGGVMVMVVDVQPGSAAATAGLEPGDLIKVLDGESIATPEEFLDRAESLTGPVPIQLSNGRELAIP